MKPVAIFRFSPGEGAGYLQTFLESRKIPWQLFQVDHGIHVPNSVDGFSGYVFMGGPMSVNDPLPWIPHVLKLIRSAIAEQKPCLGHCLGGQLMSKALGGVVTKNPVKEIGWNPIRIDDNEVSRQWLGDDMVDNRDFITFQWHGETFTIPEGATRIVTGDACANQAYVIGNSLGMQCHVEMTQKMIQAWCRDWEREHADPLLPSVQTPDEMMEETRDNIVLLNRIADRLYGRWCEGLSKE
ncbi:MAG: type 1 glutamine amidotransferase [Burkholderiales bacterium]|nr:type 1 glutamine amidotransferase [Rhodocyclaceae bacterium]